MIKTIKIPEVRSIIIREPINIDEPIVLDDHIPHAPPVGSKAQFARGQLSYGT